MNETKPTILIADDDNPTRMLLRAEITQWNYPVVEAVDGEEAWKKINSPNPPRILILDWMMPKIDGVTLCKKIKTQMSISPYIILLTQISGTSHAINAIEAGADEFLTKPFNHTELRSRLLAAHRIIAYEEKISEISKTHNDAMTSKHLKYIYEMVTSLQNKLETDNKLIDQNFDLIFKSILPASNKNTSEQIVNETALKSIKTIKNIHQDNSDRLNKIASELKRILNIY
jgi:DNA-binding response OmpR family regulator